MLELMLLKELDFLLDMEITMVERQNKVKEFL